MTSTELTATRRVSVAKAELVDALVWRDRCVCELHEALTALKQAQAPTPRPVAIYLTSEVK